MSSSRSRTREKRRNPVAAVHHVHPAAGILAQAALQREADDDAGAALYEGVELGKEGSVGLITYMRTDSTRVSNDALDEVRELIARALRRAVSFPRRPTSTRARRTRRTRTKPSVPLRRCARRTRSRRSAEDELKLYRLIWMRFVASQMTPAVFDQTTIDVAAKGKDGSEYMFRATGSVPKFEGFLEVYEEGKDQKDEEDEELKHRLPAVTEGEELKFKSHRAGAALHRAAAALQRSDAGEGTGSRRRGPALHLRLDPVHHSGTRVRQEGGRQVHADRARHGRDRPAARELRTISSMSATRRAWKRSSTRSKKARSTGAPPWPSSTSGSRRTWSTPSGT